MSGSGSFFCRLKTAGFMFGFGAVPASVFGYYAAVPFILFFPTIWAKSFNLVLIPVMSSWIVCKLSQRKASI